MRPANGETHKRRARLRGAGPFVSSAGIAAGVAAGPGGRASLEGTTLVFAHTAPHTSVLPTVQRPGQALGGHRAATADSLRLGDLQERRTTVPDGKEQLRVLVTAGRAVAPVHCSLLLARRCAA